MGQAAADRAGAVLLQLSGDFAINAGIIPVSQVFFLGFRVIIGQIFFPGLPVRLFQSLSRGLLLALLFLPGLLRLVLLCFQALEGLIGLPLGGQLPGALLQPGHGRCLLPVFQGFLRRLGLLLQVWQLLLLLLPVAASLIPLSLGLLKVRDHRPQALRRCGAAQQGPIRLDVLRLVCQSFPFSFQLMQSLEALSQGNVLCQSLLLSFCVKGQAVRLILLPRRLLLGDPRVQLRQCLQPLLCQRGADLALFSGQGIFPVESGTVKILGVGLPPLSIKDLAQNQPLFLGARRQKPLELPLRQQHHLAELLLGQANELLRLFRQHILFGVVKKGDQDPMVVDLPGGILLRQLHPLGHQPPGELIALSPDGKPEGDNGGLAACRLVAAPLLQIVAAHLALAVVAAAAAVEGEGHGVKNRGLAAARRALDEEHSPFRQLLKVHGLHLHIGPEGLHFQL